ncbi:Protein SSH4 [Debaryomyces fabryi]|uniref:Protein SSH4 n=1 Tax=Debaryomyces fabryi TaxID=58627 RepID=A0A0V1PRE8_9ASCO|nr:Protein SSH4 [Debaryomyces fabryi]KRZ98812.1 Protein SSH4 [Debaryomyces fabryi]CUM46833.1 unnamed protein product [Debaryomyces fabryi]
MDPSIILFVFIFVSVCFCLLLFISAFRVFFNGSEGNEYSYIGSDILGSDVPREFLNDEEALNHLASEYDFTHLSPEEQFSYLRGEEFTKTNPPHFHNTRGKSYSNEDDMLLKERGINAFEFEQDADILRGRYIVADRTEIHFHNNDTPYSTATSILNYSLPVKNRAYSDTIYFEVKVFEFQSGDENPNGHFAIGLVTKPYPSEFRLPGYNNFSIAYESTGNLKVNKPFPTPLQQHQGDNSQYNALVLPPLLQSDIVGFGYVVSTGTIFITRNGKKVMDVMRGCFIDLYPAVGCFLSNAKFQVNLGQLGFVWIEANVRKYGFVSNSDYKKIKGEQGLAALPEYGNSSVAEGDKLLEMGEELPPRYPEDELDFFGRSSKDILKVGSSSKSHNPVKSVSSNEKEDAEEITGEPKVGEGHRSSAITNDPEEVMDLRERLYEQNITGPESELSSERAPLIDNESQSEFYVNPEGVESSREEHNESGLKQVADKENSSSQELTKAAQNGSNISKTSRTKKKKKNKKNSKKNKKK